MCVPVLHLDLGIFPWLFEAMIRDANDLDCTLAKHAKSSKEDSPEFQALLEQYQQLRTLSDTLHTHEQITEMKHQQLQWLVLHQHELDENIATHLCNALQMQWRESSQETEKVRTDVQKLQQKLEDAKVVKGPFANEFEVVLEEHDIYRQAYFSGTFVGNHINKALQPPTTAAITSAPFRVLNARTSLSQEASDSLRAAATALQQRYLRLFSQYAAARKIFASCKKVEPADTTLLEQLIKTFMATVRSEVIARQKKTVTPKLHLLETHTVPVMKRYGVSLGLLGEQGGEGVHHHFRQLEGRANISQVKTNVKQLKLVVEHHLHETIPTVKELIPQPSTRKRKHSSV